MTTSTADTTALEHYGKSTDAVRKILEAWTEGPHPVELAGGVLQSATASQRMLMTDLSDAAVLAEAAMRLRHIEIVTRFAQMRAGSS